MRRPKETWVADHLVNKIQYGDDNVADAKKFHLRNKIYKIWDNAGIIENPNYDFKGNLKISKRYLLQNHNLSVDWNAGNQPAVENTCYIIQNGYDALNRIINDKKPDDTITKYIYNSLGLLDSLSFKLHDKVNNELYVEKIEYNAKSQRESIKYRNGILTKYSYEHDTYRLTKIESKKSSGKIIQDLRYTYDPVGNITQVYDAAQKTVFNANQEIDPVSSFTYDPIYQLREASGREHEAMTACHYAKLDKKSMEFMRIDFHTQPVNNGQALHNYTEKYTYDETGNITEIKHIGKKSWTRTQNVDSQSNKVIKSFTGKNCIGDDDNIMHDNNGNIKNLHHLNKLFWDYKNQLIKIEINTQTNISKDIAYYNYDFTGQRVRKVLEYGGQKVSERIYIRGYEIFREFNGVQPTKVWETIHVMDDKNRIAIIERERINPIDPRDGYNDRIRYQLTNHLGSNLLEINENQDEISYEEYYPYGGTSYKAGETDVEVKLKRYRYSGKERDDESGLYYYGARYYACWIGRWINCDPAGTVDGVNLYEFVKGNPIVFKDSIGQEVNNKQLTTVDGTAWDITPPTQKENINNNLVEPAQPSLDECSDAACEKSGPSINTYTYDPNALTWLPELSLKQQREIVDKEIKFNNELVIGEDYTGTRGGFKRHQLKLQLQFNLQMLEIIASTGPLTAYAAICNPDNPSKILKAAAFESVVMLGLSAGRYFQLKANIRNYGLRTWQEAGISAQHTLRIQNAANKTGQTIIVVGSRAKGTPSYFSDWDYILTGNSRQRRSVMNSLPVGRAGGEVYRPGFDYWQDYNPIGLNYGEIDLGKPHVVFTPIKR